MTKKFNEILAQFLIKRTTLRGENSTKIRIVKYSSHVQSKMLHYTTTTKKQNTPHVQLVNESDKA